MSEEEQSINPPPYELFDIDCNFTHEDLRLFIPKLIESARKVGVTQMLVPGATLEESEESIQLCANYPLQLYPTVGVHPYNAHGHPTLNNLNQLETLANLNTVKAIGECGLDYSPSFPAPSFQQIWFQKQLAIAIKLQKPLFLHERLAHDDFIHLIDEAKASMTSDQIFPPAVVHCFTGNALELEKYVAMDFYIGITGIICKKDKGEAIRTMLRQGQIPLHRLLVETDAPYMGFPKCRSHETIEIQTDRNSKQYPNVPSALSSIVVAVAAALEKSHYEVAQITTANARRLFRI